MPEKGIPPVRRFRLNPSGRGLALAGTALGALLALAWAGPTAALEDGDQAPSFAGKPLEGDEKLSLAAYRGKVIYLDFWASWCAPCLTSIPMLEKLRQELAGEDFQILAINVDRDREQAKKFLARHPVGYPSVSDPEGRLPKTFGIEAMPTSFLIDRHGVIRKVHKGFRASDIDTIRSEIRELLESGK